MSVSRRRTFLLAALLGIAGLATADGAWFGGGSRPGVSRRDATMPLAGVRQTLAFVGLVRVDAALRRGEIALALRRGRAAIALAPDLALAREQLAYRFALDLAPTRATALDRVAFVAEGLRFLDDGLERGGLAPSVAGRLHFARGMILWLRGEHDEEFDAAHRLAAGRSAIERGRDELLRAAEVAPDVLLFRQGASAACRARGEDAFDRARALEPALVAKDPIALRQAEAALAIAEDAFAQLAMHQRQVMTRFASPSEATRDLVALADASAAIAAFNARLVRGESLSPDEQARLDEHRAVRRRLLASS
jgi:hypothetical protein